MSKSVKKIQANVDRKIANYAEDIMNEIGMIPSNELKSKSQLEQAIYEAKHHQYAGEYNSLEEMRKDLYSDED